jgi:hypothetical protein
MNEENWIKGTRSQYNDPTEWNGANKRCELCDKDAEMHDDFCEDHQRCAICGDNDDCECKDEWENVSACCEAQFSDPGYPDNDICSSCLEHATSSWEEAVEIILGEKLKLKK